jgi:hypothetical protein
MPRQRAAYRSVANDPKPVIDDQHSRNGTIWNIDGDGIDSLRLDIGRPDHLTPFLGFLSHQLAEFSRRHPHGLAAELGPA